MRFLPIWDGTYEVPDVIGFADYLSYREDFCREILRRAQVGVTGSMSEFPYPNTPGKVRWMALLDPGDLLLYRAAVGPIAEVMDCKLGSEVHSSRLAHHPPAWRLRKPKRPWKAFQQESLRYINEKATRAMLQTDLERYFQLIDHDELLFFLLRCGCHEAPVGLIAKMLAGWRRRNGLRGLPIGPEPSSLLGNVFLLPVDDRCRTQGITHLRWMDDMRLFGPAEAVCGQFVPMLDTQFGQQRLRRNVEKTYISSGAEAEARIQSDTLASLGVVISVNRSEGVERARALFDEEVRGRPDAHPGTFRFVVGVFRIENDPYAARALLENPEVLNIDPRVGSEYIASTALHDDQVVEMLFETLEESASERSDARRMHLIRTASSRSWGTAEGNVLMSIALNVSEQSPVRAWAVTAARGTPEWNQQEIEGLALTETDRMTARAATATLRTAPDRSSVSRFARKLERSRPGLRFTARWAEARA